MNALQELVSARAERDRALDRYQRALARGDQPGAGSALRLMAELTTRVDECMTTHTWKRSLDVLAA